MWNYIYYICYLKEKQNSDCTGFESYVKYLIDQNEISWFPDFE